MAIMTARTVPLAALFAGLLVLATLGSAAAQAPAPIPAPPPDRWAIYLVMAAAALAALFGALSVTRALAATTWSLADALSESTEVTLIDAAGQPVPGPDGKPLTVSRMVASSSRLIAILGLIGILSLFVMQGLILIWQSAHNQPIAAQAADYAQYLVYGSVMFAPYVVNKFSSVFQGFGPGRK
ncbi:MAG TPA: hypothetical protein VFR34_01055 [Paracoccaceae bacterium]|nr:hypothetical protein [Paracoccaceae bacterium]